MNQLFRKKANFFNFTEDIKLNYLINFIFVTSFFMFIIASGYLLLAKKLYFSTTMTTNYLISLFLILANFKFFTANYREENLKLKFYLVENILLITVSSIIFKIITNLNWINTLVLVLIFYLITKLYQILKILLNNHILINNLSLLLAILNLFLYQLNLINLDFNSISPIKILAIYLITNIVYYLLGKSKFKTVSLNKNQSFYLIIGLIFIFNLSLILMFKLFNFQLTNGYWLVFLIIYILYHQMVLDIRFKSLDSLIPTHDVIENTSLVFLILIASLIFYFATENLGMVLINFGIQTLFIAIRYYNYRLYYPLLFMMIGLLMVNHFYLNLPSYLISLSLIIIALVINVRLYYEKN